MPWPHAWWPVAAAFLCACSDGAGQVPVLATRPEACQPLAAAWCKARLACNPVVVTAAYGDEATCAAREALGCRLALSGGAVDWEAVLATCAGHVATLGCGALGDHALAACRTPVGAFASGAACLSDGQCQSGHCTLADGEAGCGTCYDPTGPGGACTTAVLRCGPGLRCGKDDTCGIPLPVGATCTKAYSDAADACWPGGRCGYDGNGGGVCKAVPPGSVGSPCAGWNECDESGTGSTCHGGACVPIALAETGKHCDTASVANHLLTLCRAGACFRLNDLGFGSCVANAADGAACEAGHYGDGPGCTWPAACDEGRCALPVAVGCE